MPKNQYVRKQISPYANVPKGYLWEKYSNRLSQAQIDTLGDLLAVSNAEFSRHIQTELELAEEI